MGVVRPVTAPFLRHPELISGTSIYNSGPQPTGGNHGLVEFDCQVWYRRIDYTALLQDGTGHVMSPSLPFPSSSPILTLT